MMLRNTNSSPLEKLFQELPKTGELDISLGRDKFTIPITRVGNTIAKPLSYPEEVFSVSIFEPPESSLDNDAEHFIEEEDELGETIELPKEEGPTPPSLIELKPLPAGLRYAFLHGNKETPIIISDKLTKKETAVGIS